MTGQSIEAHFQPIVRLKSERIVGFEALARPAARSGEGGALHGASSKSGADNAGLIQDGALAATMLEQACAALASWRARPGCGHLFVQVNVTGDDLLRDGLVACVKDVLGRHALPPGALIIEITEHLPIGDMDDVLETLVAVKAAGAGLVLDDFGSGYSSLSWLHDLPVDGLKIDGELTRKLGSERGNVILAATVQLGHALGLRVTAEGVEDRDYGRQLRAIGVDQVQGFAYGAAMSADAVTDALAGNALRRRAGTPPTPRSQTA